MPREQRHSSLHLRLRRGRRRRLVRLSPRPDDKMATTDHSRQVAQATARDERSRSRGRDSISNSCCASNGFRKDFRINGHVGESTSKDTSSFSSHEHQIEGGIRKGYAEMEIMEAVVRAVNPGLKLRSYLEGKKISH